MNNANNNVPPLEMIVDVRPVLDHIDAWRGAWVVSTCVGRNGRINKKNLHGRAAIYGVRRIRKKGSGR